jgi:acyl-CoA synthetase (AMP-forming)/AMP-acid ligase II
VDRAARLAGQLRETGLQPGDVALLIATPSLEFLVGLWGCMWAGVIAAPISFPRRPEHLESRLAPVRENAGAVAIVAGPPTGEAESTVLALLSEGSIPVISTTAPGDPAGAPTWNETAYLQYTSGSTGDPRGVIVTQDALMANLLVIEDMLAVGDDSVVVSWNPLTHDMGLIMGALPAISHGITSVLMPPSAFIRRPLAWLRAIDRFRGTHGYSPNFGYDLCVDRSTPEERADIDLSSARCLINGAEPVRRRTRDRFFEAFLSSGLSPAAYTPAYGMAECSVLVSAAPPTTPGPVVWVEADALERNEVVFCDESFEGARELCGSGLLGEGYEALIVDPDDLTILPPNRVGELWLRGPSVCAGYWKRPEATEQAFGATPVGGSGRYLRTGDLAFFHDGELVICGRLKDLIIINGRNLHPQDLELSVELAHDAVRSGGSAAFPIDDHDAEVVVVVAEVDGTPDEAEVGAAIRTEVRREFEVTVADVLLVPPYTVPKTSSGKKQRGAARELWSKARSSEESAAT